MNHEEGARIKALDQDDDSADQSSVNVGHDLTGRMVAQQPDDNDDNEGEAEQPEDEKEGSSRRGPKRKRNEEDPAASTSRISKAQVRDMRDLVEHLVIVGNCHRHQYWRRKQYKEKSDSDTNTHHPNDNAVSDIPDGISNGRSLLLNAEDTLLYGQNHERGAGDSIAFWPNPSTVSGVRAKTISDAPWETMYGDAIDPIAFSSQRLSSTSYELWDSATGMPNEDLLHPRHHTPSTLMDPSQATRSILLKCWHRAVHAVSLVTMMDTMASSSSVKDPRGQAAGQSSAYSQLSRTSAAEDGASDSAAGSSSASLADPSKRSKNLPKDAPVMEAERSRQDTELQQNEKSALEVYPHNFFSTEQARDFCDSLGIALTNNSAKAEHFHCPVCQADMESFERLSVHFYGKPTSRGCAWIRIQKAREALLNEALTSEVSLQARQLAQLVAARSIESIKAIRGTKKKQKPKKSEPAYKKDLFRPAFSWAHVQSILHDLSSSRQSMDGKSKDPQLSDTLDVALPIANDMEDETILPPVHLNEYTLEAISNRLQERYTRIPR